MSESKNSKVPLLVTGRRHRKALADVARRSERWQAIATAGLEMSMDMADKYDAERAANQVLQDALTTAEARAQKAEADLADLRIIGGDAA